MRKEERSGRNKNPVLITYCSATSYPKSQCHITSTVLLAHESVDVQSGHCSTETVYLYLHMVFARLTWGWRRYLTSMSENCAGCRMQSFGVPTTNASHFQQDSLIPSLYSGSGTAPSKVYNSHSTASATFCPTRPAQTSGEGKEMPPSWWVEQHVQTGMGRTTGGHLCKHSVISPTTGNHCNIKEIKRKNEKWPKSSAFLANIPYFLPLTPYPMKTRKE